MKRSRIFLTAAVLVAALGGVVFAKASKFTPTYYYYENQVLKTGCTSVVMDDPCTGTVQGVCSGTVDIGKVRNLYTEQTCTTILPSSN